MMGDGDGGPVFPKRNPELRNALFLAYIVQSYVEGSADLDELYAAFVDIQEFPNTNMTVLAAKNAIQAVKSTVEESDVQK